MRLLHGHGCPFFPASLHRVRHRFDTTFGLVPACTTRVLASADGISPETQRLPTLAGNSGGFMDAMQQLLLASGFVVCGGVLGSCLSWILASRRTRREAFRLASLVEAEPTAVPSTPLPELAPLLAAWGRRQDTLQAGGEAQAMQY